MTPRQAVRVALMTRDETALVRAYGRFRDAEEAERVAHYELRQLDAMTRSWWAQPQPGCDGVNCLHDHELSHAYIDGWMEGS